jgi:AraC-like DNA-binding protein
MLVRRVVEASGMLASPFRSIAFSSNPFGSLDALRPWLCDALVVGERPGLRMTLRGEVLGRPLPFREAAPGLPPAAWLPLGPGLSLREGLGLLLSTMLLGSVPTIGEVARVAGMSQRSLQRQLHGEGSSFREVLDAQRRQLALNFVHRPRVSLSELSQSLGYGHQSSLTRAFRRWTDESPRTVRRERAGAVGEALS